MVVLPEGPGTQGVQHALPSLRPRLQAEFPGCCRYLSALSVKEGKKRVAQLRTPLADLTENRHRSRITPDQRGCDEKSISN